MALGLFILRSCLGSRANLDLERLKSFLSDHPLSLKRSRSGPGKSRLRSTWIYFCQFDREKTKGFDHRRSSLEIRIPTCKCLFSELAIFGT